MNAPIKSKVFRNGRSRAVRIPAGIDLPGDEVTWQQEGRKAILEPVEKPKLSLAELIESWEPLPLDDRFEPIEDYPPEPVDL